MVSIRGRMVRLVSGALIASGAFVAVGISPAAAAGNALPLNTECVARFINNDGTSGGEIPPGSPFPLPTTVARVGGPTEVNAGMSFNGVGASIQVPVPAQVDTKVTDGTIGINGEGVVNVWAASNIVETIKVSGASSIGTPTISGGNVQGATVTKIGSDTLVLKMPGTHATNAANFRVPPANTDPVPGNEKQFDPGASFTSPKLTIPVNAGAAGTTVKFTLSSFQADSDVDAFDNLGHIFARAFCDPAANLLGAVQVVSPPPPGAPNAVADVATTNENTAVTLDVLDNDTANAVLAINEDSLAVTANPAHGTAKVNVDHTITYTPAAGFSGGDSFTYKLCSLPEAPTTTTTGEVILTSVAKAVAIPCDTAKVSVTVLAPQETAEAPQATPTTVAAAAELPRTGSSSTPLALLGFGLCAAGLAAAGFAKSRRRSTVS